MNYCFWKFSMFVRLARTKKITFNFHLYVKFSFILYFSNYLMMFAFQFVLDEWFYIYYLQLKDVNISSEGSTSGSFSDNEIQRKENVDDILAPSNSKEITYKIELMRLSNSMERQDDRMHSITEWKPLDKDICLKGIEMFGKNRYRSLLIFHITLSTTYLKTWNYFDFFYLSPYSEEIGFYAVIDWRHSCNMWLHNRLIEIRQFKFQTNFLFSFKS